MIHTGAPPTLLTLSLRNVQVDALHAPTLTVAEAASKSYLAIMNNQTAGLTAGQQ